MKKRTVINFVCIFLSILLAGTATGLMFNVIRACEITGDNLIVYPEYAKNLKLTDLSVFMSEFENDMYKLSYATGGSQSFADAKTLENEKTKVVNEAIQKYNRQRAEYIEEYMVNGVINEDNWYDEYFNTDTDYTVPQKAVRNKVTYNEDAPKTVREVSKILNGTSGEDILNYDFLVPEEFLSEIYFNYEKSFELNEISYTFVIDELTFKRKLPKKYIETSYETFLKTVRKNGFFEDYEVDDPDFILEHEIPNSVKYYVVNKTNGSIHSNFTDNKIQNPNAYFKELDNYYANIDGKIENTGFEKYIEKRNSYPFFSKNFDCYITIDTSNNQYGDYNIQLEKLLVSLKSSNIQLQLILAVVFAILTVILTLIAILNSGQKRVFIDKLFTDIHLTVSAILDIFAVLIAVEVIDSNQAIVFSNLSVYILSAIGAFIWAITAEFLCSLVRVCKSDKKLLHNCFIFLVLRWFARKIKKFFTAIKTVFSYRPNELQKSTIPLILCIFPVDIVFGLILFFCVANGLHLGAFLSICVLFGANIALAVFWIKYLISLDKIIVAAKERTDFEEDLDKLPQSLKTLQESMKYTNLELKEAVAKAVKDERLRTELITNVSHDLKTPLTSIITYVDLLNQCNIEDEKAKEYIKVLDEKGLKLKRLIEDLIEASKVSSGNITLNCVNLNLSELCVQAVGEMSEEFEKRALEIKVKLPDNPPIIYADGNKTFRVIENLLSNAKKYSAQGTRVYISIENQANYGAFEIKNISESPLDISAEELTERFVRGDKSRTNEGNGLGLSIAKELCNAMGGKLMISIDGDLFKAKVILPTKTK